jgi:hypothetical protein
MAPERAEFRRFLWRNGGVFCTYYRPGREQKTGIEPTTAPRKPSVLLAILGALIACGALGTMQSGYSYGGLFVFVIGAFLVWRNRP